MLSPTHLQKSKPLTIKFVTIEGNIGSGKSTLIKHIQTRFPEYSIVDEPVDVWTSLKNDEGKSLLELFYEDKIRWSYTFQNSAFITRTVAAHKAIEEAKVKSIEHGKPVVVISERGILTDRYVFASMLKADKCLNQLEWDLYTQWFDHFSKHIKIDGIVYVTTESDVCADRIKIRGRQGEDKIPQVYLDELHEYHENWLNSTELPVLRITSNVDELERMKAFVDAL